MEKKKVDKKLNLNKKAISNLNQKIKGGGWTSGCWSSGCTDGCGPLQTEYNCTRGNCTEDCNTGNQTLMQTCGCTKPPCSPEIL